MGKWHLESIEVTGGFLGGLSLRFPPRLTCIIGPRGSGKSTLAEAIRCGLAGTGGLAKPRLDLVKANLGSAAVTLATSGETPQARYTVRRTIGQPASLTAADGRPVSSVDLDRGTFLPLDAFTSLEIEAIADESLGEKRRSLLDELRPGDLQKIMAGVGDLRRALEANADAITAAERTAKDLGERIEELGDARARLAELPKLDDGGKNTDLVEAATQRRLNQREMENIATARSILERLSASVGELAAEAASRLGAISVEGSANADITRAMDQRLAAYSKTIGIHLRDAVRAAKKGQEELGHGETALKEAQGSQAEGYLRLQQQRQEAAAAVKVRTDAEQAVATLAELESRRSRARDDLERLREERKQLRGRFLLQRDKVSDLRQAIAGDLGKELGHSVRIRVLRNADSLSYRETLLGGLRGARVKNHDEILVALLRLRPEQLAQIIADDDGTELEQQTSLGKERCRKILDSFRLAIDPLALEVEPIDDRISIELNVAAGADPLFRDAAELSRGQKCTAMLPLLLARRDNPLVIDQPEDNLDNHFIYETVVESIRRLKVSRQMVFITHNANIPVLGEADLVVVLNSDGKRGFIEKAGTFEECRNEIIDLLEGGRDAFEMRSRRYGPR